MRRNTRLDRSQLRGGAHYNFSGGQTQQRAVALCRIWNNHTQIPCLALEQVDQLFSRISVATRSFNEKIAGLTMDVAKKLDEVIAITLVDFRAEEPVSVIHK